MRFARFIVAIVALALIGAGIYMYENDISYTSHVHETGYRNSRFGTGQMNRDETVYFNALTCFVFAGLTIIGWIWYEKTEQ